MDEMRRQDRSRALGRTLPSDLGAGAKSLDSDTPSDPDAARLLAMLEVAYLAASADDKLTDHEIEHLVANLQSWLGAELDSSFLVKLFEHLGEQLGNDGFDRRIAATASALDPASRRVAYKLACVTALCDHDVHDDELRFLGSIAEAFEIPLQEAQQIFDALDEALAAMA